MYQYLELPTSFCWPVNLVFKFRGRPARGAAEDWPPVDKAKSKYTSNFSTPQPCCMKLRIINKQKDV